MKLRAPSQGRGHAPPASRTDLPRVAADRSCPGVGGPLSHNMTCPGCSGLGVTTWLLY